MPDDPIEESTEDTAEAPAEESTEELQAEEPGEPADEPGSLTEHESTRQEVVHVDGDSETARPSPSLENVDLLLDVALQITAELGRKEMTFGEILQLTKGSVVELNKLADGPVDIFVNRSKVAEGEVVVIDDHFGVRITRILNNERLKRLG